MPSLAEWKQLCQAQWQRERLQQQQQQQKQQASGACGSDGVVILEGPHVAPRPQPAAAPVAAPAPAAAAETKGGPNEGKTGKDSNNSKATDSRSSSDGRAPALSLTAADSAGSADGGDGGESEDPRTRLSFEIVSMRQYCRKALGEPLFRRTYAFVRAAATRALALALAGPGAGAAAAAAAAAAEAEEAAAAAEETALLAALRAVGQARCLSYVHRLVHCEDRYFEEEADAEAGAKK